VERPHGGLRVGVLFQRDEGRREGSRLVQGLHGRRRRRLGGGTGGVRARERRLAPVNGRGRLARVPRGPGAAGPQGTAGGQLNRGRQPMRRPIIAANWKMHKTHLEAMHFVESLRNRLAPSDYDRVEVVVCPPFTALRTVQTTIDGADLDIGLGAQNMHWEEKGAYTGEISSPMLGKLGVSYVIIGHSERREHFGETDEWVNRKVKAAFDHDLVPIMCVGETLAEREAGGTEAKVEGQVRAGLAGVTRDR